jgi:hypothetical protein
MKLIYQNHMECIFLLPFHLISNRYLWLMLFLSTSISLSREYAIWMALSCCFAMQGISKSDSLLFGTKISMLQTLENLCIYFIIPRKWSLATFLKELWTKKVCCTWHYFWTQSRWLNGGLYGDILSTFYMIPFVTGRWFEITRLYL